MEHQVHQELAELQVHLVQVVHQVHREALVHQEHQVHRELAELQVQVVHREVLVQVVHLV